VPGGRRLPLSSYAIETRRGALFINKLGEAAEPKQEVAMDITDKRTLPTPTGVEQADCVLTPEQKRELTIDTMASWALDGLHPTPEIVERINAYLRGEVTMDEYLRKLKGA
jgi:hypothetical protein